MQCVFIFIYFIPAILPYPILSYPLPFSDIPPPNPRPPACPVTIYPPPPSLFAPLSTLLSALPTDRPTDRHCFADTHRLRPPLRAMGSRPALVAQAFQVHLWSSPRVLLQQDLPCHRRTPAPRPSPQHQHPQLEKGNHRGHPRPCQGRSNPYPGPPSR